MDQTKPKGLLRRFIPYYKKYKGVLFFDLFCAALTTVCELVLPLLVREITNRAVNDIAALTIEFIVKIGVLYLFLRIIDTAANFFMASIGHIMGAKMETDMRRQLFAHLQKLSFSYYDNAKVGKIMSRITSDLFDVTEFAHHGPEEIFISAVKMIGSFVILCSINWKLTLIVFAVVPLMFIAAYIFNKKMRTQFRKQRSKIGEINAQVEDSLLGVRVVKSFANEDIEQEKFAKGNDDFYEIKKKSYFYMGGFDASNRIFDGMMNLLVLVVGSIFIIKGYIQPGDMIAYLMFIGTLISSIRQLVQFTEQFQRGMTGIERFFEIMDSKVEIFDEDDAKDFKLKKGEVIFDNVSFSYADDSKTVLSDINITVNAGENIALVGPSGGGKTTLCNLIPRFYDVSAGRVLIDGQDIRKVKLKSLREQIGFVQQDVYLFSGSVFENIQYGKPGASHEDVVEAAKKAGAHEFIMGLLSGYDTYVGERGVKLSGGQKQRISIARAFLKNPPIMILDEATSALDNESEKIVQQSLETLSKGRTTFTIAHRLTTIKNATKILVLTDNGIEEQGSHDELMAKKGIYYNLYNSYGETN